MIFIETPIFTKLITGMLPDDIYRLLQQAIVLRPDAGDIISGSGGLRKIRWALEGRGKSGSLRIIYYWDKPYDSIYMLFAYKKTKQEDLTKEQLKVLRKLVEEWL
jgi:hypothetical protein